MPQAKATLQPKISNFSYIETLFKRQIYKKVGKNKLKPLV
jgi:hypothetical protein